MVSGLWGRKIGMTQLFDGDKVVPVTAIDVSNWIITGLKTQERDGYCAVQVGNLKKRYADQSISPQWFKKPAEYFLNIREIRVEQLPDGLTIGRPFDYASSVAQGDVVNVSGVTKGKGFAGVVKRWNFGGPPATHGSTMGKRTGSLSFMRAHGRVIKGKKMPGHMGVEMCTVRNLSVVKIAQDAPVVFVKGALPGHAGSLLFIERQAK